MSYKLGSLFDGSGGFPLAGSLCGVEPVWASEVEPYPIAVTRSCFPSMKHLGSVTDIHGGEVEPVDIITFGSPCQDLSVAGKRAGLKHEANGDDETTRSGLFMEAVRIIKEMREATNGKYPTFALWENVPGAFSSNKGEDFRTVLEELIRIVEPNAVMPAVPKAGWAYADSFNGDGWSLAYRVFDAQYWGVPQRRRRIHLVLDLRGERARKVLFEREGVRRYFAQSETQGQGAPTNSQGGSAADDREGEGFDGYNGDLTGAVSATLGVNCGTSTGRNGVIEYSGRGLDDVIPFAANQRDEVRELGDKAGALQAQPGMKQQTFLAYSFDSLASNSMKSKNPHSGCREVEVAKTLDTTDPNPSKNQGGIAVVEAVARPVYAIDQQGGKGGANYTENVMPTLCADSHGTPHAVAYTMQDRAGKPGGGKGPLVQKDRATSLRTSNYQYVFQPKVYPDLAQTLTARHDSSPQPDIGGGANVVVQAAGFCTEHSAKARGVGYQEEVAPTLRAGVTPACLYEWHNQDSRVKGPIDAACTLNTNAGGREGHLVLEPVVFDGANVTSPINKSNPQPGNPCHTLSTDGRSYVVESEPVYCLQGNGIDRADTAGCNGKGWKEDASYTLNTIDRPAVAYATDVGFFNTREEVSPTLLARGYKDPHLVTYVGGAVQYLVRRLTPTECARLQGFVDKWGHIDHKDSFTEEEYRFWLDVRNTHAAINGKQVRDYTAEQMLKWYNALHTDSAEYKLWGNGIALPPALYCLQGMTDILSRAEEDDEWML